MVNLDKIMKNERAMFLAYDHGLEHGPVDFDEKIENFEPENILKWAVAGKYDAVVFQKGIAEKYYSPYKDKISLIVKLNGKSKLAKIEPYSPQNCEVSEAVSLGAAAVGYTIYLGSFEERRMLKEFAKIVRDAHAQALPVVAWMYPRGESVADDEEPEIIAYAARAGLELGADVVKIKYPKDGKNIRWVRKVAGKTKVVLSGGVKKDEKEFIVQMKQLISAGWNGVAVGRNVWQSSHPLKISEEIYKVVHGA